VGRRIVAEVIIGLMVGDRHSFLHQPAWQPIPAFTRKGTFGIAELIRRATGVSA